MHRKKLSDIHAYGNSEGSADYKEARDYCRREMGNAASFKKGSNRKMCTDIHNFGSFGNWTDKNEEKHCLGPRLDGNGHVETPKPLRTATDIHGQPPGGEAIMKSHPPPGHAKRKSDLHANQEAPWAQEQV